LKTNKLLAELAIVVTSVVLVSATLGTRIHLSEEDTSNILEESGITVLIPTCAFSCSDKDSRNTVINKCYFMLTIIIK